MKKTLLFVREKSKDSFIKTANDSLKFVNNLFEESKKLGFDDETAWKLVKIAYEKQSPAELESEVRNLIIGSADEIKISGLKLSIKKIAELVELPDIKPINELIEQAKEKRNDFSLIPFEQIKRDKNIELSHDWLVRRLESFSVFAENERQAQTFHLFTQLVKSVNDLVKDRTQRRIFECLEDEGLLKFEGLELRIVTEQRSLTKMFNFFGG